MPLSFFCVKTKCFSDKETQCAAAACIPIRKEGIDLVYPFFSKHTKPTSGMPLKTQGTMPASR